MELVIMNYYFEKTLAMPFEQAIAHVTEVLAGKGFGVLTTIDVSATMKKKLGVDLYPYTILGACNPGHAYRAIQAEERIGTMLPCNVILTEKEKGKVVVSAVDPIASMSAIDNPALGATAAVVRDLLKDVVDSL
jgi:uncharacterized protein (DUF302 family)